MRISKTPEQRRTELIAAARVLFDERGVDKTRVSDIVKKVGVAQGVFYYYFSSKEEMVDTVVSQVTSEIKAKTQTLLSSTHLPFCERMAHFIEVYIDLIDQFLGDDQTSLHSLAAEPLYQRAVAARGEEQLWKVLEKLVVQGVEGGDVLLEYPNESAKVLMYGLRVLAEEKLPSRMQIYTITEHGLGLPKDSLIGYLPMKHDPLRGNKEQGV